MGCGASAKRRYAANVAPEQLEREAPTTKREDGEDMTHAPSDATLVKKRPSFADVVEETARDHEGHKLTREFSGLVDEAGGKRPTVVQTALELHFIEVIPALYGTPDSEGLREELKEEMQANIAKRCVMQPATVRSILSEWLHDCPDEAGREKLIQKALKAVSQIAEKPRGVTFDSDAQGGEGDDEMRAAESLRPSVRKGTNFEVKVQPPDEDEEDDEGEPQEDHKVSFLGVPVEEDAQDDRPLSRQSVRKGTNFEKVCLPVDADDDEDEDEEEEEEEEQRQQPVESGQGEDAGHERQADVPAAAEEGAVPEVAGVAEEPKPDVEPEITHVVEEPKPDETPALMT